jgi:hypothetical protein
MDSEKREKKGEKRKCKKRKGMRKSDYGMILKSTNWKIQRKTEKNSGSP